MKRRGIIGRVRAAWQALTRRKPAQQWNWIPSGDDARRTFAGRIVGSSDLESLALQLDEVHLIIQRFAPTPARDMVLMSRIDKCNALWDTLEAGV